MKWSSSREHKHPTSSIFYRLLKSYVPLAGNVIQLLLWDPWWDMQPNPTMANLLRAEEIFCKVRACLMSSLEQWLGEKKACWMKNLGCEERPPGTLPRPVKSCLPFGLWCRHAGVRAARCVQWVSELVCIMSLTGALLLLLLFVVALMLPKSCENTMEKKQPHNVCWCSSASALRG